MCGIAGFTGQKNISKLDSMLKLIEHRGRDGRTLFYSSGVHLGMNRLAIIDLVKNLYPMRYKHNTMVFNGEIYNYKELKKQLELKNILFNTNSDAEVILPLYDLFGSTAFSMLEGMFAISLYDDVKHELILARDKSGEKPLYYTQTPAGLFFASEIKVLLAKVPERNVLDTRNLNQYLTQGFVFSPNTLVEGIHKIPPSCCMVYDVSIGKISMHQYWEPMKHIRPSDPLELVNDAVDRLEVLIRKSVRLRLIADVPVGCFLSGGADSSLVTLFASQEKSNIRTYSVSFPGYSQQDESEYASYVAYKLQTKHTIVTCGAEDVYDLVGQIGKLMDEPIIDPAVLPTLIMAKEARKKVKVVLTGEGADELFGGYDRYRRQLTLESVRQILSGFPYLLYLFGKAPINRIRRISQKLTERYSAQCVWNDKELKQLLVGKNHLFPQHTYMNEFGVINPLLAMQLTDYRGYMAEQLLMKIDKSTMASNLEARAPYLDTNIITFAFSLFSGQKIHGRHGKYILKKLADRYFPKPFVWRAKHGFDLPLAAWFRKELRDWVDQSVKDLREYSALFDADYYRVIVREHMDLRHDHSNKIWSILVLTNWMKFHTISLKN